MKNPAEFWAESEIGESAKNDYTPRPVYERCELVNDEGFNIFNEIARIICETNPKNFVKGYIELDKIWLETTEEVIVNARKQLEDYQDPFGNRRAYLMKIPILTDETTKQKSLGGLKPTKSNFSDNWYMWGRLCIFHNEDLGWTEEELKPKSKKTMIDGELKEVEGDETAEKFQYLTCSCFVPDEVAKRLLKRTAGYMKENPDVEEVYCFIFTLEAEPDEYQGKKKAKIALVDDFVFME